MKKIKNTFYMFKKIKESTRVKTGNIKKLNF